MIELVVSCVEEGLEARRRRAECRGGLLPKKEIGRVGWGQEGDGAEGFLDGGGGVGKVALVDGVELGPRCSRGSGRGHLRPVSSL